MGWVQASILRPDLVARDCDECRQWVCDKNGPITRNGKRVPRPKPPRCERCEKRQLGVEELDGSNREIWDAYRLARLSRSVPARLTNIVLYLDDAVRSAERVRWKADMLEVVCRTT